jgi:hypothetical protein
MPRRRPTRVEVRQFQGCKDNNQECSPPSVWLAFHQLLAIHYNDVEVKEVTMSIAEIIPAVQALSRGEKFQLAHLLLEDRANEERATLFQDGQIYSICTPEYAPGAAAQLAQLLREEETRS